MPLSSNVSQFAAKCQAMGPAMNAANTAGLVAAAEVVQVSVLTSAKNRGWNPEEKWARVFVGTYAPIAMVTLSTGPAYWAERGTRPHVIEPKRGEAILTPQGPRVRADHPGSRGRPFWHAGVAASRGAVGLAFQGAVHSSLGSVFGR